MTVNDCARCGRDMGVRRYGYYPEIGAVCMSCWAEIRFQPGEDKPTTVVADVMEDDAMTKIANDALALLDEAIELLEEWEPADLDEILRKNSIDSRRDQVLRRYTNLRIKAGTRG